LPGLEPKFYCITIKLLITPWQLNKKTKINKKNKFLTIETLLKKINLKFKYFILLKKHFTGFSIIAGYWTVHKPPKISQLSFSDEVF